jgi:anti-repressor protein
MEELQILNIDGVDCYEENGVAYLKLENVAKGLGFTQAKNDVEYIRWDRVADYLREINFPTCGENIKSIYIPENVFYRLAMKAKNDVAEKFQAKVADEIIPSIRKTGGYIAGQEKLSDEELLERAVLVAHKMIAERDKVIAKQQEKIEQDKPKVIFADAVSASEDAILIRDLAKLLRQNNVPIGERRFYSWLREHGYICKNGTAPTQKAMEMGLFEVVVRTVNRGDALPIETSTTKVTTKGQMYFVNKFLGRKQD